MSIDTTTRSASSDTDTILADTAGLVDLDPTEPVDLVAMEGLPLAEQVYFKIRRLLMAGSLQPWDRIAEEPFAARFDVSRTPVREALKRLENDGLLQRRSGGLFPYVPRHDQLADLYDARIVLESHGVQAAPTQPRNIDRLEAERRRWAAMQNHRPALDAGFVTQDERFHIELLASANNPVLVEMLALINQRIRPVRMYDYLTAERMDATIHEHLTIAELVLSGDTPAALSALVTHITTSRDVVIARAAHRLSATLTQPSEGQST